MRRHMMKKGFLAAAVVLAVAAAGAFVAPARGAKDEVTFRAKGFDHTVHEKVSGLTIVCNDCHQVQVQGDLPKSMVTKKHDKPCGGCHKDLDPLTKNEKVYGKYCELCHSDRNDKRENQGFWVNEGWGVWDAAGNARKQQYGVRFSHKTHAGLPPAMCMKCHGDPTAAREPVAGMAPSGPGEEHKVCAGCHATGVSPPMAQCTACHKDKTTLGAAAVRPPDDFRVLNAFGAGQTFHVAHVRRAQAAPEAQVCATCHDNLGKSVDGQPVPLPTMQNCYDKCHNGTKAPDATGMNCKACHTAPAAKGGK